MPSRPKYERDLESQFQEHAVLMQAAIRAQADLPRTVRIQVQIIFAPKGRSRDLQIEFIETRSARTETPMRRQDWNRIKKLPVWSTGQLKVIDMFRKLSNTPMTEQRISAALGKKFIYLQTGQFNNILQKAGLPYRLLKTKKNEKGEMPKLKFYCMAPAPKKTV